MVWALLAISVACGERPEKGASGTSTRASALISDQVHNGGTQGFFFLPPLVPATAYGTYSPGLAPVVTIDELSPGVRGNIASFTTSSGTNGAVVKDEVDHYQVNWDTKLSVVDPGFVYRISVKLEGVELGFADVAVVATGGALKNVATDEYIPLLDGRTLPIKFRIDSTAQSRCLGIVCTAVDACHEGGVCDSATGTCTTPVKSDGASCDDGNACTLTDVCVQGSCVGSAPVTCWAVDQCHDAGTCDPVTGVCSDPARLDGSSCDDLDGCTHGDTCQAGACVGSDRVTCDAQDQCHEAGTCDSFTGLCSNPTKVNGSGCSDGNACSLVDVCQAGTCVGTEPVTCAALDACHDAGSCDPASGACSSPAKPAGASCADGNACNGLETCDGAGRCLAGALVLIDDGNPCTIDSCDPMLGAVHAPAPAGTSCADADLCNGGETCDGAGRCVVGAAPVLDDGDPCTADACYPGVGIVHSPIAGCGVLPPDPATVAPPSDLTVPTDIASSTAFLYTGSDPSRRESRRERSIRSEPRSSAGSSADGMEVPLEV